ncbi:hypothetical protein ABPG74_009817 [Tetrahymena malaccensis]
MKNQVKKAKKLQKRCENINKLFDDVETKYNYCNLNAYARKMLQPMLNQQQEFVKQKHQRVYGVTKIINLPWQTQELSNEDSNTASLENSFQNQQEQQIDDTKQKIKRAFRQINYSLNEVIQKEEILQSQKQQIQVDESFEDEYEHKTNLLEECSGCSMKQSVKEVQQKVTFYEKNAKKNLKTLPKLIEENTLIQRITSLNILTQELKKARGENKQRIQKYLIEDYIDYLKRKQDDNQENSFDVNTNQTFQNSKPQTQYQKILPEIFKQKESPQKGSKPPTSNKNNENKKHFIDIDNEDNPFQEYFLSNIPKQKSSSSKFNTGTQNKATNANYQDEYHKKSNKTQQEENYNTINNDKDETTINSHKRSYHYHDQQQQQQQQNIKDYGLNPNNDQHNQKLEIYKKQYQSDSSQKRAFNFDKMNQIFQLKRVINPIKFVQKPVDIEKNRQELSQINLKYKQDAKLYQQKSLSHNSSQQNLLVGSTANNSYISNISRDQIKSCSNTYNSNSQLLWSKRKDFIDSKGGAFGSVNHSALNLNQSNIIQKKFNLPKEFPVPDFVKKIKDLIIEVEQQGENPLSGDQTIELANILSLISMQKEAINYTGKTVTDYQFNMQKEHFIVPQKSRENQLNVNTNSSPVYGSIAMLDKIYQINLPSIYILQGPGKDLDKIK